MVNNMYMDAKTWNAFQGCRFGCTYCVPSFQRQAKRQRKNCERCYDYTPHEHPERLGKIPNASIVFVCGSADISFCKPNYTLRILASIRQHSRKHPETTYYLQSKRPAYFTQFLDELPAAVVLVTTLETNRDKGYRRVSWAPLPSIRYRQFKSLDYPRKVLTLEPLLDFDLKGMVRRVVELKPEYVWVGMNTRGREVRLNEPSREKVKALIRSLKRAGVEVRRKYLGEER